MMPANLAAGSSLARFFFFCGRILLPARLLLRLPAGRRLAVSSLSRPSLVPQRRAPVSARAAL